MNEILATLFWIIGGIFAINYVYYRWLRNTVKNVVNFIAKRVVSYVLILALSITICWFWSSFSVGDAKYIYIFGNSTYWFVVALWMSLILYVLISAWQIVLAAMGLVVGGALWALVCLIGMPFGFKPGQRKSFTGSRGHKKAVNSYRHVSMASGGARRF